MVQCFSSYSRSAVSSDLSAAETLHFQTSTSSSSGKTCLFLLAVCTMRRRKLTGGALEQLTTIANTGLPQTVGREEVFGFGHLWRATWQASTTRQPPVGCGRVAGREGLSGLQSSSSVRSRATRMGRKLDRCSGSPKR
jgi:hypothetical protein